MKKKLMVLVLTVIFAFPVVVKAQTTSKITSSRYDIEGSEAEIAEEYVCDTISERVIDLMDQGEAFEVSEPVIGKNYEYSIISIPEKEKQIIVGYLVKDNKKYELIEITSPKAIEKAEILHYFK